MPFSFQARSLRVILGGSACWMLMSPACLARSRRRRPRLRARGQVRCRRVGLSRAVSSVIALLIALISLLGGKRRLVADLAADDAQGAHEGDAVGIFDVVGGLEDQMSDGVVRQK